MATRMEERDRDGAGRWRVLWAGPAAAAEPNGRSVRPPPRPSPPAGSPERRNARALKGETLVRLDGGTHKERRWKRTPTIVPAASAHRPSSDSSTPNRSATAAVVAAATAPPAVVGRREAPGWRASDEPPAAWSLVESSLSSATTHCCGAGWRCETVSRSSSDEPAGAEAVANPGPSSSSSSSVSAFSHSGFTPCRLDSVSGLHWKRAARFHTGQISLRN